MNIWVDAIINSLLTALKNPLTYWALFMSFFVVHYVRHRQKTFFRKTLNDYKTTWFQTNKIALLGSLLVSGLSYVFGFIFTYEIIVILTVITFILSIGFRTKFLSSTYILGFTYFLMLPTFINFFQYEAKSLLISITFIVAIFLFIEAFELHRIKTRHFTPEVTYSKRGTIIGQFSIERFFIVPFFVFVPEGDLSPLIPLLPFGSTSYDIAFIPFIFGFNYRANDELPQVVIHKIKKQTITLASVILIGSILSIYVPYLTFIVMAVAIIGHLYIQSSNTVEENRLQASFLSMAKEPIVFWVEKGSIAESVGLEVGDQIIAINDQSIHHTNDFDSYLLNHHTDEYHITILNSKQEEVQLTIENKIKNRHQLGLHFIDQYD